MMVSTKGRYALRVMIDLAEHQSEGYVPLKEIAARQEISEKYLESILKVLVQQRFLEGLRGKGGGYKLTRAPETYTVGSILRLTEGAWQLLPAWKKVPLPARAWRNAAPIRCGTSWTV